ncbi:DUF3632 domain-containing protein [Aspergillus homomorphus CBS 101889]|uniref:Uncharacterized protein n=1 Tax=Aspergillus homomorphus (strain CBS 101889) TaxID=1450537 RepID=A0A395HTF2_ASPHC|nr:hypothetical protein BO97DRAFT_406711 [Aspergillus homomorphus CBS 101889]RAL10693.1 hypothetical protein BO97DRAFT_406711 [Aspergillus homomorphus CBS 101889]
MSDSPMEPPSEPNDEEFSYAKFSIEYRESLLADVERGNLDELRDSVYNRYYSTSSGFGSSGESFQELEPAIRDLWFAFHVWASNISHVAPEHDRVVLDFVRIQGSGPLRRLLKDSDHELEVARGPAGALWSDLPFFLEDTITYFFKHFPTMKPDHRLNFTHFVAKVASTGLLQDRVTEVGLLTFREALETSRPLGSLQHPDDWENLQGLSDMSVAAFFPAIRAWVFEHGRKMINLCDVSWKECDASSGLGGPLFLASELSQKSPSGLSPGRWLFWIKRVDEIHQRATEAGETKLADEAWATLELMLNPLEDRDCPVSRAYHATPDDFIRTKWPEFWASRILEDEDEGSETREAEAEN